MLSEIDMRAVAGAISRRAERFSAAVTEGRITAENFDRDRLFSSIRGALPTEILKGGGEVAHNGIGGSASHAADLQARLIR